MNNEEMELFCYLQDDEDYENDFEQDYKRLLREDIPTLFDYIKKKDKEIARLNTIIETLDLYFKYMVDDRDFDKVSQLSDRAFNEYITLSIVEDYYKLVKEEPDEQLKEIKEQIKKEGGN